eukprot:2083213-Rhodomonas_salina.6
MSRASDLLALFSALQGIVTTSPSTPPGLYPLSLALSAVPTPGRGVCVDAVVEWRSEEGLRCSEVFARGVCGSNGTMGGVGWDVCCECGGGQDTGRLLLFWMNFPRHALIFLNAHGSDSTALRFGSPCLCCRFLPCAPRQRSH